MSFLTAESFVFNGTCSEDFQVSIAWLQSDADVSVNGLNREIQKSAAHKRTSKDNIYGSEPTDNITFSFCLVKDNGEEITREESIRMNRWLTSSPLPKLLKFNDKDSYMLHYYAVCTQIKDIIVGGRLVGKELNFETNSPFAFMPKIEKTFDVTDNLTFSLYNTADTYDGIYYPTVTVSAPSGSITIENKTDKKSVTLDLTALAAENPGSGKLTLDSSHMTILDSCSRLVSAAQIGWNEAYQSYVSASGEYMKQIYWLRLLPGLNEFQITGSCTLKIECEFPRKAGCL